MFRNYIRLRIQLYTLMTYNSYLASQLDDLQLRAHPINRNGGSSIYVTRLKAADVCTSNPFANVWFVCYKITIISNCL